jgi:hypothetical protein
VIDGIKIKCNGTTAHDWQSNILLKFYSSIDEATGEILTKNKVAFYRGLSFHLIPSTVSDVVHCFIKGSLAVFHNYGLNNAYDFDFSMLSNTIQELKEVFAVNPNTAQIQTFEAGANLNINQPIKQVISGLRAYQNENFVLLKIEGANVGRMISRTEYALKIYDKGKQSGTNKNLLRLEYAFKKSRHAHKFSINVLADLLDVSKLEAVKMALCEFWANVIFYDKGLKLRDMNDKETKKMLYYLDATNWAKFSRMQRKRATVHFKELSGRFSTSTTQTEIGELLRLKLDELTAVKCYDFPNFLKGIDSQKRGSKMLRFPPLDEQGNSNIKQSKNKVKHTAKKMVENGAKNQVRECCKCGSNISHKKPNSKYCSKHCNNSTQAKKRKMNRQNIKEVENQNLSLLLHNLAKSNLLLLVEYATDTGTYADRLEQKEINTNSDWICAVIKVTIEAEPVPIFLTSYRARKLIKSINKLNT